MRIVVVRALHLGDLLCATPALHALRTRFPDAEITLVGLSWARALLPLLAPAVDDFVEFPSFPGIPERPLEPRRVTAFLADMQRAPLDLAVQLHGSGSHINELVALLGADRTAGFYENADVVPANGCFVPWPRRGTEVQRLLTLTRALGCADVGEELRINVGDADASAATMLLAEQAVTGEYVCLHPGARFPSRRWPPERFAAVGDAVAEMGLHVVLTGTENEAPLTRTVRDAMRAEAADLTGRLDLGTLAALVRDAALVVCNDTGMSHVAAAVATRSVVVASGSEVARWAPAPASMHRVLWHDRPCRPCAHEVCPTLHECATAVQVADVVATAELLLNDEVSHA
ncbi:MAG TPA: glycosyltransferase family 9 protein [Gemmatimonadaceae bacterium]